MKKSHSGEVAPSPWRKTAYTPASEVLPTELISVEERNAIRKSFDLYRGRAPWLTASEKGLALASGIAAELARLTVVEFSADFDKSSGSRMLQEALRDCFARLRVNVEYACALGGVIFKPCYDGKRLTCETVLPLDFLPLETDGAGVIVSCAFLSHVKRNGCYYTRVEEHRKTEKGYRITNRAFVSESGFDRGKACPLSAVMEWASLSPAVEIAGLSRPLFAYFGIPLGNLTAPSSPLGVPVFRRAEELIRQADLQFGRLLWEFEGGEMAIDASEDAFRLDKNGNPRLPLGKERLYRTNVLDAGCSDDELLKTFAPPCGTSPSSTV
jgi:A118 family predicted phage portal protein